MKSEIRFYVCLLLGYILIIIGIFCPPIGVISNSVLIGFGMLISLGAVALGLDLNGIKDIIHEIKH